ncbi:5-formyltetrahydrofolate cyclo-ligase [Natronohydrobacter thiooxidans]|jgi:5-formyltetrahydrofolate cyclo-ligase|uniref:5-formyltetrahydrofolate cyclo-ligase n=1 Tax=Natronohydrobacter thiooxidans TaxID=87172 RepID=UPI0008FF5109|nr:5-formyltetrahydrofolate cyclo-ligase [Natronohydrobacter thiooxidans]
MTDALAVAKKDMRREAGLRRDQAVAAGDPDRMNAAAAARVADVLAARFGDRLPGVVLSAYMAMRGELDPRAIMTRHPGPVCVPVITGKGQPLDFHRWTPEGRMVAGTFGAMIPETREALVPEVLIVPLLAFDRQGYRLGYGGGFYDRTLERLRAAGPVLAIGFAFDTQEVPLVPIEATDQRLDLIVTPERVMVPE